MMGLNSLWLIGAAAILMLLTGLAIMQRSVQLARGRKKKDTPFKRTIITILVGFFAFSSLGIFVMFGLTSWSGGAEGLPRLFLVFQSLLCVTTIVIATAASYGRLPARIYIYLALFISLFLYPFLGRILWHDALNINHASWLADLGFRDIAGATLIHSVAGWVALATLIMFGLRKKSAADIKHKLGLRLLSALLISVGIFSIIAVMTSLHVSDFNAIFAEDTVRIALTNALYASFSSLIVAVFASLIRFRRLHVRMCTSSFIAGLVAISGSAFTVDMVAAVLIGAVAAVLMMVTASVLESLNISDALNIVPTHLVAGIWGSVAVGLFANTELLGSNLNFSEQLAIQLMGVAFYGLVSFLPTCVFLWLLAKLNLLGIASQTPKATREKKATTLFSTLEDEARARQTSFKENVKATQALSVLTSYDPSGALTPEGSKPEKFKAEKTNKPQLSKTARKTNPKHKKNFATNFHTGIIMTDKKGDNTLNTGLRKTDSNQVAKLTKGVKSTKHSTTQNRNSINSDAVNLTGNSTVNPPVVNPPVANPMAERYAGFQMLYPSKDIQAFIWMLEDEIKASKPASYNTDLVLSKLGRLRSSNSITDIAEHHVTGSHITGHQGNGAAGSDILAMQLYCTALSNSLSYAENMVERITTQFVNDMYFASALHRISFIGVDDELLFDVGDYDAQDYTDFESQSMLPYVLIEKVSQKSKNKTQSQGLVQMFLDMARAQHERWDGTGQAQGLQGEEIPLAARIVNLVNTYVAVRSKAISRLSHPKACQYILLNSMKQFDPVMVHHFFRISDLFEDNFAENFKYIAGINNSKAKYTPLDSSKVLPNKHSEARDVNNTFDTLIDM